MEDDGKEVEVELRRLEGRYIQSQGRTWINGEDVYSSFCNQYLADCQAAMDVFLKVQVSDLDFFCSRHGPDASWLRDMLADALMFFKLHNAWQVYICPIPQCLCWFSEDDSLILHLIHEHSNHWPFLQQNPTEGQWCAQTLHDTVWKPIDVTIALDRLSTTYRHLNADQLGSLEWPLSDDITRSQLLVKLQMRLSQLLDPPEGDSLTARSYGCLRAVIAVASEEMLTHLNLMNILPLPLPLPFKTLLYCSPLSFRFMEAEPLRHFVDLVEGISFPRASQNRDFQGSKDGDVDWSKSGCHDVVSYSADFDYFVLDDAELKLRGISDMGLWFYKAPFFPTIKKLPVQSDFEASEILQQAETKAASFSELFRTGPVQSNLNLRSSCLKIWNVGHWPSLSADTSSPELASNSEFSSVNVKGISSSSCYSFRDPAKRQRTEFQSQPYLELIKLTWELQFFELQVRQLCAVDLRVYILALLKSFLRMRLYAFISIALPRLTGHAKEEDADEGPMKEEGSQGEHPEAHVHRKVKGEPAAEDGSDVMMPELSSHETGEELSNTPLELRSSGGSLIGISNHDPMMIDSGEALGGGPPVASAGDTGSRVSQVASSDAALSMSRTSIAAVKAESGAKPEAIPDSDAEPESQLSQEVQWPACCDFDLYPDSDSDSKLVDESTDEASAMNELSEMRQFSGVVWLMRGRCCRETKDNGLFVRMMINDVIKDCQKEFGLHAARNIWGWKTNRTLKYWHCIKCEKSFPDQKSHMLHMECEHNLGLSWDPDWSGPSQVPQEGQSIAIEGVMGRTRSLDDSITVDSTYRTFMVEMETFKFSYEFVKGGEVQNGNLFGRICDTQQKIKCLVDRLDTKRKQCWMSESGDLDAEIVENFAKLKKLKQELSNLCVADYEDKIMASIQFFLLKRNLGGEFRPWVLKRLNELLSSVRCRCLPDSFSISLASSGKVIINIKEYNAGISFAYIGIRLKFAGVLSSKGSKEVKGIYMFSAASNSDNDIQWDDRVVLNKEIKMTAKMNYFKTMFAWHLARDLMKKLPQFQAECKGIIQGCASVGSS